MGRKIRNFNTKDRNHMIFKTCKLNGAYIIEIEKIYDTRGYFARSFCREELDEKNLNSYYVQCNLSFNRKKGTLRGMHFQRPPHEEIKLVSCVRGAIYDVIIDLRKNSDTYLQWQAFELSADNKHILYVPKGFAHGFQTLEDSTEVFYQMSEFYYPEYSSGVRWDDEIFGIIWPDECNRIISEKDMSYRDYDA